MVEGEITVEYKEWVSDNLEWLIEVLGYEDFYRRPFFDLSDSSIQKFYSKETFSLDEFTQFLKDRLQIEGDIQLVVNNEKVDDISQAINVSNPALVSRDVVVKELAEELLLYKAKELGLLWEGKPDDAVVIGLLSAFYGVSSLMMKDNFLQVKNHVVSPEVFEFCLAIIFSIKETSLITFLDLFGIGVKDRVSEIIEHDDTVHKFQQLSTQFKGVDRVIRDLNHANEMHKNGYYPLAISIIKNLCNLHPGRITIWNTLGYYQQRNKQYTESLESFDKALLLDENFVYALNNKGLSLLLLERTKESEKYFLKAEKLDREEPLVLRNIGIYHAALNEMKKAKVYFEKALSIAPNTEYLHYYYGITLLQSGEKEKALQELNLSKKLGEREAIAKLGSINP